MRSYSKSAKRKMKRAQSGTAAAMYEAFELEAASVPQEPEEDPLKAPLQARANRMGSDVSDALREPMLEHEAGQALTVAIKDADYRKKLFDTFMTYDRARSLFASRCLNMRRFPAVSRIEFMPERLEASANDPIDLRGPQERADGARDAMRNWDALLDCLPIHQRRIIRSVSERQEVTVIEGELTTAGRSFVAAAKALYALAS